MERDRERLAANEGIDSDVGGGNDQYASEGVDRDVGRGSDQLVDEGVASTAAPGGVRADANIGGDGEIITTPPEDEESIQASELEQEWEEANQAPGGK